jgi:acyltransferase
MTKRIKHIDLVRGITILLVVAGHAGLPNSIHDFLRNFRMPLFFIVTGFLFSKKYLENSTCY